MGLVQQLGSLPAVGQLNVAVSHGEGHTADV